MSESISLEKLAVDDFVSRIGCRFRVAWPGFEEALTLEQVDPSPSPPGRRTPFSLIFKGQSTEILLNQQIHPLEHDDLGRMDGYLPGTH